MPKKAKSYTKPSDQKAVLAEMSQSVPMIVRIHKTGCPACENSEDAWQEFCDQSKGIRTVQVEEQAVPPQIMKGIEGCPTYAVHKNGNSWHHTGALMDAGAIEDLIDSHQG
jgi:DnaJ-class molecular chaperone